MSSPTDYEEVLADVRRLTRELDVAMHGEAGAARQASLCDLVGPARTLRLRAERAEAARLAAALVDRDLLQEVLDFLDRHEDVIDGDDGRPMPNAAMSLRVRLEAEMARK